MYNKIKKIHLIGIGGIGMSGIAELLHRNGYTVSGSDLVKGDTSRALERIGIKVFEGHLPENVIDAELVVYSSAITAENPELKKARENNVPVITRAEMLAELMRLKYGIAVAGAHGKTTTTSMVGLVLMKGDLDPTIVVGGRMDNFGGTNARLGNGPFMVVEADESDGSFNRLTPSIAVVTNIDREHMDYYQNMRRLKKAFVDFLNKVPFYGLSVLCGDDPYLKILQHQIDKRKKTFGFQPHNQYRVLSYQVEGTGSRSIVELDGHQETLILQVPGKHNVSNALSAIAIADELSVPRKLTLEALAEYHGVQRRFHRRGQHKGVSFIDDYAHHPNEIRATLLAAREQFPESKVHVVFQPHRYSRVNDLIDDFASVLKSVDTVAITDIYGAGEDQIEGVSSEILVEMIQKKGHEKAYLVHKPMTGVETCLSESAPGDVILTLGAGDLPSVYKQLF